MNGSHRAFHAVPPSGTAERDMLTAWLTFQRETLAGRCVGLTAEQLRARSVPSSNLSLLGLLQHMAGVERGWFRTAAPDRGGAPFSMIPGDDYDLALDAVNDVDPAVALATWRATCRLAGEIEADTPTLETVGLQQSGRPVSLRWVMLYLIQEYARHNGHADVIRECIDRRPLD